MSNARTVSFDSDLLILVDPNDNARGSETKARAHDGEGLLHRAFSVFLLNQRGEVLLQQRSAQKRLWPLYWSNACCSHPRLGEETPAAAQRRTQEELGLTSELRYLYKFQYQARYGDAGSENELCHVFIGRTEGVVAANSEEIAAWRWVSVSALNDELERSPQHFTPWFKLEWRELTTRFANELSGQGR